MLGVYSGLGEDPAVTPGAPPSEAPAADARQMSTIGKGLFVGTAYGIALGMVLSEFVMRKGGAEAQLKQNHQLVLLGALFGAGVGAVGAVQKQALAT
jgi:hypothetical protein